MDSKNNKDVKILMLGARRAGKSSVLSSLVDSFNVLQDHGFTIAPDEDTQKNLTEDLDQLRRVYNECKRAGRTRFMIDEKPNSEILSYRFTVSHINEKKQEKDLGTWTFIDIPGESMGDPEYHQQIREYANEAGMFIVAVDTVHLMEEEGNFFYWFNRANIVSEFFDRETMDRKKGPRMVLFVPLKCEKYYHEGRMEEVTNKLIEAYSAPKNGALIPKLEEMDWVSVAVVPILTIGSVVFDDFGRDIKEKVKWIDVTPKDEKGKINQLRRRPTEVYFKLHETFTDFAPKYCEQPMLYALAYGINLLKNAKKEKAQQERAEDEKTEQQSWIDRLREAAVIAIILVAWPIILLAALLSPDVQESWEEIKVNLKTNGDGYCVLQDKLHLIEGDKE